MVNECPVCSHPINAVKFLFRPSARSCSGCGSLLWIDKNRRYLALIPIASIALAAAVFMSRAGWTAFDFAVIPAALVVWLPCVLLLERAIVLERRGFWCQACGYDLRGQVHPSCPECGRAFDSTETAQMESPDPTRLVQGQGPRRVHHKLILLIAITVALTLILLVLLGVCRRARPPGISSAPTMVMPSPTVPYESRD